MNKQQPYQASQSMLHLVTDIAKDVHDVGKTVQARLGEARKELAKAGVKKSAALDRIERELQPLLAIDSSRLVFQGGAGPGGSSPGGSSPGGSSPGGSSPGGSSPGGSSPGGSSPGGSSPGGSSPGGRGIREIYQSFVTLATSVSIVQQIFQRVQTVNLAGGLAVTSPREEFDARSLAPQKPPVDRSKG